MMSESLLLQFCYQCDLGSLETTFETMQNRVQWNFEAFLEDLRKKNGQNDNEFQGYIWPRIFGNPITPVRMDVRGFST
jgi:hypothetical protein